MTIWSAGAGGSGSLRPDGPHRVVLGHKEGARRGQLRVHDVGWRLDRRLQPLKPDGLDEVGAAVATRVQDRLRPRAIDRGDWVRHEGPEANRRKQSNLLSFKQRAAKTRKPRRRSRLLSTERTCNSLVRGVPKFKDPTERGLEQPWGLSKTKLMEVLLAAGGGMILSAGAAALKEDPALAVSLRGIARRLQSTFSGPSQEDLLQQAMRGLPVALDSSRSSIDGSRRGLRSPDLLRIASMLQTITPGTLRKLNLSHTAMSVDVAATFGFAHEGLSALLVLRLRGCSQQEDRRFWISRQCMLLGARR